MASSALEQDAIVLLPSLLFLLNAAFGAFRGEALIVPTKVERAHDPTLFWATVSASAILGATGLLLVCLQAVGRVGGSDLRAYSLMLLMAALLG